MAAAKVEGLCYSRVSGNDLVAAHWTRVEDLVALARLMGYGKIGMATCIGLLDEAHRLRDILRAQGLEPYSQSPGGTMIRGSRALSRRPVSADLANALPVKRDHQAVRR